MWGWRTADGQDAGCRGSILQTTSMRTSPRKDSFQNNSLVRLIARSWHNVYTYRATGMQQMNMMPQTLSKRKRRRGGRGPDRSPRSPPRCSRGPLNNQPLKKSGCSPAWQGYRESRRCSRDTYPESYTTKYTSTKIKARTWEGRGVVFHPGAHTHSVLQ